MTQCVDVIKLKTIPSHCSLIVVTKWLRKHILRRESKPLDKVRKETLGCSDWWVHNVGEWSTEACQGSQIPGIRT